NAAREPEIVDLGKLLISMGAEIDGLGTGTIEITGRDSLNGTPYAIIPDRIEAATLLIAGAITHGCITVIGVRPAQLSAVIELLINAGCRLSSSGDSITVKEADNLRATGFTASPYRGIPGDLPAPRMAPMA